MITTDYYLSISKEEIAELPLKDFDGKSTVITTKSAALKAIKKITENAVIGLDTETRPAFKKGVRYNVSLIQIATPERCFLFRINKLGLLKELVELIENPEILKIGVSLHDDFCNLNRIKEIFPSNCLDLQEYVKQFKIQDNGLQRIYGILFGKKISKGQRLTNWEAQELTEHQIAYASLDAAACLDIYNLLSSNHFNPDVSTYKKFPEVDEKQDDENLL